MVDVYVDYEGGREVAIGIRLKLYIFSTLSPSIYTLRLRAEWPRTEQSDGGLAPMQQAR